jgi:hypothetical protein
MSQTREDQRTSALASIAVHEMKRYARHPLFIVGALLTAAMAVVGPDKTSSSLETVIVPAAALGVFGVLVMASLVRSSDEANSAAGAGVASERTRTLALAAATVVPFSVGLAFFGWAVWAFNDSPPLDRAAPFGDVGSSWAYAVLFALGALPAVGGPILGLVVGRWLSFRGSAIVTAVLLVLVTIVMQGLIEPLRFVRVVMPWTYFAGPFGVHGDSERWLILTGSPQWYFVYLVALCTIGVLVALLHDREASRATLVNALVGVGVVAAVLCALAMTQGVQHTMVNPLPSSSDTP